MKLGLLHRYRTAMPGNFPRELELLLYKRQVGRARYKTTASLMLYGACATPQVALSRNFSVTFYTTSDGTKTSKKTLWSWIFHTFSQKQNPANARMWNRIPVINNATPTPTAAGMRNAVTTDAANCVCDREDQKYRYRRSLLKNRNVSPINFSYADNFIIFVVNNIDLLQPLHRLSMYPNHKSMLLRVTTLLSVVLQPASQFLQSHGRRTR